MTDSDSLTTDFFHRGRIKILQPKDGYRAAVDPVFLAASLDPPRRGQRLLDVGCGSGVAGFCALSLMRQLSAGSIGTVHLHGIDVDRAVLELAVRNACENRMESVDHVSEHLMVDIADRQTWPEQESWDQVFSNPPYLEEERAQGKAKPAVETANMETRVTLREWLFFMAKMLKNRGRFAMIHRADRLTEITSELRQLSVGSIEIFPLWPKQDQPAKRVIIRGRKGGRSPDRVLPGMILHQMDGSYTEAANAVLNGEIRLPF